MLFAQASLIGLIFLYKYGNTTQLNTFMLMYAYRCHIGYVILNGYCQGHL